MAGIKGRPWGNALGGYRHQRRVGGRFVAGFNTNTIGYKVHTKTNTSQKRARYKKAAIVTSAIVATAAVTAGGVYAYKKGLIKPPHAGQPKKMKTGYGFYKMPTRHPTATASINNVAAAATQGSGLDKLIGANKPFRRPHGLVGTAAKEAKKAAAHVRAMVPSDETLNKTLHGAKAATAGAAAVAATSTAARITVGNARNTIKPQRPSTGTGPRPGGRPRGSRTQGKKAAKEVTKESGVIAKMDAKADAKAKRDLARAKTRTAGKASTKVTGSRMAGWGDPDRPGRK